MLSINDLILQVAEPSPKVISVGVPSDFVGSHLPDLLAGFRKRWPEFRFLVRHGSLDMQLNDLRHGRLDIAVNLSAAEPATDARHHWVEQTVWLRGRATRQSSTGYCLPPRKNPCEFAFESKGNNRKSK